MAPWHKFGMIYFFVACICFTTTLFSSLIDLKEEDLVKRVYSHLVIRDYRSALEECEEGMQLFPESSALREAYIRTLAENGKDDEAILRWKKWKKETLNHDILEALAWGVLHRSENSRQIVVNIASLMGAFYTHDVRAVQMLRNQMHSSNAYIRAIAVQFAPQYRDEVLIQEVKRLFDEEKVWYVRLEVIKALGAFGTPDVREPLKQIVANSRTSAEEKALAAASLVNLYESIDPIELSKLIKSKRGGLRLFACHLIAHLDLTEEIPSLITLLEDPMPDVRIAALNTLYLLGLRSLSEASLTKIEKLMDNSHPELSITAAWIALRFSEEKALETLCKWVYSSIGESRRYAAFALGHSGKAGREIAKEAIKISPDPFVRVNAALGLIRQESDLGLACSTLYQFLITHKENIMWEESTLFQVLAPSRHHHIPQVPQYPALMDQLSRLEILNFLAILQHPKAEEALKSLLTNELFGVTYAASNTLLEEGGEEALNILRHLLQEKDEKIRVQAAMVLALSGSEPEAIDALQEAYFVMDREMKINILGAIGHIGDRKSIPFLLDLLDESHQILKVVTASALIQCLYH